MQHRSDLFLVSSSFMYYSNYRTVHSINATNYPTHRIIPRNVVAIPPARDEPTINYIISSDPRAHWNSKKLGDISISPVNMQCLLPEPLRQERKRPITFDWSSCCFFCYAFYTIPGPRPINRRRRQSHSINADVRSSTLMTVFINTDCAVCVCECVGGYTR